MTYLDPVQYKGTQTDELISSPEPARRKQHKFEETGDAIMAKEDEEVRPESKLARAGVAAIKTAAAKPGFFSSLADAFRTGWGGSAGAAGAPAAARATRAAPTRPFWGTVAGQPMRFDRHGNPMVRGARGNFRAPTGEEPSMLNNRIKQMSHREIHHLNVRRGLTADSAGARFMARAKDMVSHPAAAMVAPIAASTAMGLIPAGHDEYGNRRSLADTGAGQMAANIGVPLALAAAPSMIRHAPGIQAVAPTLRSRPVGHW